MIVLLRDNLIPDNLLNLKDNWSKSPIEDIIAATNNDGSQEMELENLIDSLKYPDLSQGCQCETDEELDSKGNLCSFHQIYNNC